MANGNSGSFYLSAGFITIRVDWSETYDIASNTSVLSVSIAGASSDWYGYEYYLDGGISMDGASLVQFHSYYPSHRLSIQSQGDYYSVTTNSGYAAPPWKVSGIAHNADGTKSVTISLDFYGYTGGDYGGGGWHIQGSQTVALTTIPRTSGVSLAASSVNMGGSLGINISRASTGFKHDLRYVFGSMNGVIATDIDTAYTWAVPLALASQIPSHSSGYGTIYCDTKSGGTVIGTSSVNFTAVVPNNAQTRPSVEMRLEPYGYVPNAFSGLYIQGKTGVRITLDGTAVYSSIASYSAAAEGKSYSGSPIQTDYLGSTGEITVTGRATDKRGYTGTAAQNITVLPYGVPRVTPPQGGAEIVCRRCNATGAISDAGEYLFIQAGRSYSKVFSGGVQRNFCTLRYRYKAGSGAYTAWTTILAENAGEDYASIVLSGFAATQSYTVEIGVTDTMGEESSVEFPVSTSYIDVDMPLGTKGISLGKYSEKDGFECNLPAWFYDDISMEGKRVTGLGDPQEDGDAVPWKAVKDKLAPAVESAEHPGCYYRTVDGVTEWINPPLVLGVEYRTTERFAERPVYTKFVQLGVAASGQSIVQWHEDSAASPIRHTARFYTQTLPLISSDGTHTTEVRLVGTDAYIFCVSNWVITSGVPIWMQVWYYK